jgi:adenosylcobinamide-GDP ribazoletransferase
MLNNEIRYFFTSLMFFTRIPCPSWVDHSDEYLNKSRKYFPMIGWIVGGLSAVVLWAASFVLPMSVCIVLSIMASVWTTGAFHEDGFTDVCDSFGAGWNKAQILTIMKDSRIGAYGVIGMVLLVLLKFMALSEIAQRDGTTLLLFVIVNAHTTSRFIASTFVHTHDYVQDLDVSKSKPIASQRLSLAEMSYSGIITLVPFVLFQNWRFLLVLPIAYLSKIYLGYYFKKHIGGYTGDCLGATQQVSEVVFYLAILGLQGFF